MGYTVPTSWAEVSLAAYQRLLAVPENLSAAARSLACAAAMLDMEVDEVRRMPASEYAAVAGKLAFSNARPRSVFRRELEVNGRRYRMVTDLTEVTLGELIDLEEYVADWPGSMHKALAVLFREPEGDGVVTYDPATSARAAVDFLDGFTAQDAYGASLFFSLVASGSSTLTRDSSGATA